MIITYCVSTKATFVLSSGRISLRLQTSQVQVTDVVPGSTGQTRAPVVFYQFVNLHVHHPHLHL